MKQLTLDFALPPESVITLAIPFTADLTRELVTHGSVTKRLLFLWS